MPHNSTATYSAEQKYILWSLAHCPESCLETSVRKADKELYIHHHAPWTFLVSPLACQRVFSILQCGWIARFLISAFPFESSFLSIQSTPIIFAPLGIPFHLALSQLHRETGMLTVVLTLLFPPPCFEYSWPFQQIEEYRLNVITQGHESGLDCGHIWQASERRQTSGWKRQMPMKVYLEHSKERKERSWRTSNEPVLKSETLARLALIAKFRTCWLIDQINI